MSCHAPAPERIFHDTEDAYRDRQSKFSDEELTRRVILVPSVFRGQRRGTLAYLAHQSLPVYLADLDTEVVTYTRAEKVPGLSKFVSEEDMAIDGYRALLGKNNEEVQVLQKTEGRLALMLVNTTVCGMSCTYCYAGDHYGGYEKVTMDLAGVEKFLKQHGWKFNLVIVYGGDSLMLDGLSTMLRNNTPPDTNLNFVTGMGYARNVFEKKMRAARADNVRFTFSVDPLPTHPEDNYHRVFKLYPGNGNRDWYWEMMDRIAWCSREFPREVRSDGGKPSPIWGTRPSITQKCYDYRQLRADLCKASGYDQVSMNMEPAVGGAHPDDPTTIEMLSAVDRMLDLDVEEIVDGRLDLRLNMYLRDPVLAILNPHVNFSPGGCYTFFNRISLGPRGEISFCNEAPTYDADERGEWMFGDVNGIVAESYARVMDQVYKRPELCQRCDHRFTCGTSCPIKLLRDETGGCMFTRLRGEKVLKVVAGIEDPSVINVTLPARMANLRRWSQFPILSKDDLERHARFLLR